MGMQFRDTLTYISDDDLVQLYNEGKELLGSEGSLRHFQSRNIGESVIRAMMAALKSMHGFSCLDLDRDESGELGYKWIVEKPVQKKSDPVSSRESQTTLDLDLPLRILTTANPKRADSRAWQTFEVYRSLPHDATGEEYVGAMVAAGYTRRLALSTLHWDIGKGFVRLGEPPAPRDGAIYAAVSREEVPSVSDADVDRALGEAIVDAEA